MSHDYDFELLSGLVSTVEGFEDEELLRRLRQKDSDFDSVVPRVSHARCPHCGKDIFFRTGEHGAFELMESFDPDLDGADSVTMTDVIAHHCDEGDLFIEDTPF